MMSNYRALNQGTYKRINKILAEVEEIIPTSKKVMRPKKYEYVWKLIEKANDLLSLIEIHTTAEHCHYSAIADRLDEIIDRIDESQDRSERIFYPVQSIVGFDLPF